MTFKRYLVLLSVSLSFSACLRTAPEPTQEVEPDPSTTCQPACPADSICVEGVCELIHCDAVSDCASGYLCREGRCVLTCDGFTPCLTECVDGLCMTRGDCSSGDTRSCSSACGEGVERCVDQAWTACSVGAPEPSDQCGDGQDNDCDGLNDEGCPACETGELKSCESACGVGEQRCEAGAWSPCSVSPPDASGLCPCEEGSSEVCETPCGVGVSTCQAGVFGGCLYQGVRCECSPGTFEACELSCGTGYRRCDAGQWTSCQGQQPRAEVCMNGVDDDCDQQTDEGCAECTATPLSDNDYFTSLAKAEEVVPMVTSGDQVWLSWPTVTGKTYLQGARFQGGQITKGTRLEPLTSHVADLSALGSGRVVQIGVQDSDAVILSTASSSAVEETVSIDPTGTIWEARVVGDASTQQVLYRTSALYLQRTLSGQPGLPAPLRLSNQVSDLGYDVARGGGRLSVLYPDATEALDEGHVLTLVQASSDGGQLIGEGAILHPVTREPLYTSGALAVVFKSSQLLVAYSHRTGQINSIRTALLSLEGEVLSGPHTVVQMVDPATPEGISIGASQGRRALVWHEQSEGVNVFKVKYVSLDEQGLPTTDVKLITRGRYRVNPQVDYLNELPVIMWTQSDLDPEFGGDLHSLRLAQFDHDPVCE